MNRTTSAAVRVEPVSPYEAVARELVDELDTYLRGIYLDECCHFASPAELSRPGVRFVIATVDGQPAGCGAARVLDGYGELKRFFVRPGYRGLGVADALMDDLEAYLAAAGVSLVRLETGEQQHGALRFFARRGYQRCGVYGHYLDNGVNVFMERRLDGRDPAV